MILLGCNKLLSRLGPSLKVLRPSCNVVENMYGWLDPKINNVDEATYIGLGIIKYTSSYSQLFPLLMTECVQAGWQQLLGRGRM